ncbi:MAG: hypothetical protein MUE44_17065 [Oscillatoriaceae cyanobacterium Prado104]|nr:hypothetical protein [Oscillatoriaceae cyanobacterium Prado104]
MRTEVRITNDRSPQAARKMRAQTSFQTVDREPCLAKIIIFANKVKNCILQLDRPC